MEVVVMKERGEKREKEGEEENEGLPIMLFIKDERRGKLLTASGVCVC